MRHIHGGNIYGDDKVLDFSANINPLGMPEAVKEAIASCGEACLHYPDPDCRRLREAISLRERVPFEQILCGNGAAELIYLLVQAKKPKKILLTAPSFAEYEAAGELFGAELLWYPCRQEEDFRIREDYPDHISDDIDMAFLCSPNNPTGHLPEPELLKRVLEKCREKDCLLVMDECFLDFLPDKEKHSLKRELPGGNLVILKAFTKIFAMPGLRLGYCLSADTGFLERMQSMRQPWSVSVPAQLAGTAALSEEGYEEKTALYVKEERSFLKKGLSNLGIEVLGGEANFLFFFTEIPAFGRKMRETGILIRDCSNYKGLSEGYYRIAVRNRKENEKLLETIAMVREQKG